MPVDTITPDGGAVVLPVNDPAGPAAARPLFDIENAFPNQFHYADGFFVVS